MHFFSNAVSLAGSLAYPMRNPVLTSPFFLLSILIQPHVLLLILNIPPALILILTRTLIFYFLDFTNFFEFNFRKYFALGSFHPREIVRKALGPKFSGENFPGGGEGGIFGALLLRKLYQCLHCKALAPLWPTTPATRSDRPPVSPSGARTWPRRFPPLWTPQLFGIRQPPFLGVGLI